MKRVLIVCSAALLGLALLRPVTAGETAAPPTNAFKTKTRSVAVFKDGYGFFVREGKASLHDGWCMTDYIPKATAGTFWFYTAEPDTAVITVRSTWKNMVKFRNAGELSEALRRKMGLQVKVQTEDVTTEGKLIRVLDDVVLVEAGKQVQMVDLNRVESVQILGQPLMLQIEGRNRQDDVTVNMGYLQQGISWVPSYTMEIISDRELSFELRGTITNGVEDLEDSTIYLVVGVPNFSMKGQLDPLAVHAIGTGVIASMPVPPGMVNQVIRGAREYREDGHDLEMPRTQVPMEGLQDMYFYKKEGLDVAAGDVVMTTVMTGALPYRSLFTWNADQGKEVYHNIVISNRLSLPLTTGPVMVVQNGKPISQDEVPYTPAGAESRVKLTLATDIRTESSEKEIERGVPERFDGLTYIPVETEGRLLVQNHRKDAIEVEIVRSVSGKVIETSDDGSVQYQAKANEGLNPQSNLKWTIKVDPGKERVVTYRYVRYVRANA